jgi:ketosteroid isomerase-like protein
MAAAARLPALGRAGLSVGIRLPHGRLRRRLAEFFVREGLVGSYNRGELDVLDPFTSADFEGRRAPAVAALMPTGREDDPCLLSGAAEFRRYVEEWDDFWAEFHIEPKEAYDLGDRVLVLNHLTARGASSGVELNGQEEAELYVFRGGRCVRWQQYWSWAEGLADLDERPA